MRPTFFFSGYSTTNASVSGWTSSDRDGTPMAGGGAYSHPVFNGSFGGRARARISPSPYRGVVALAPEHRRPHAAGDPADA